jgi:hypothetical protein
MVNVHPTFISFDTIQALDLGLDTDGEESETMTAHTTSVPDRPCIFSQAIVLYKICTGHQRP